MFSKSPTQMNAILIHDVYNVQETSFTLLWPMFKVMSLNYYLLP